ncbi:MAG: hypothetical protein KY464_09210 [Gemmatimonadetes bacterium]|nr:hypothetical protein [Gemmatimonadota bacterium]
MPKMLRRTLPGVLLLLASCAAPPRSPRAVPASGGDAVTFRADFDRGSMGPLVRVAPGHYVGVPRHWRGKDGIDDQYYWWYFQAVGTRDRTLTIQLDSLSGTYRGGKHEVYTSYTFPVYSYDRRSWQRIPDVSYDGAGRSFRFTHRFERDTVWIAYAHPYPWARAQDLVASLDENPYVRLEEISRSGEGRPITLVTITDPRTPQEGKKTIFVQALQHSGEDAGGFFVEGMIRFLLSDDELARRARERFVYRIVPVMNPDGLYRGVTRFNAAMEDLNSSWSQPVVQVPEVAPVRRWLDDRYAAGKCVAAFLDVHNHTQQGPQNTLIVVDDRFAAAIGDYAKEWNLQKSTQFRGSASEYMAKSYGVPSTTVELSQSHAGDGKYLDISDYERIGARTVMALTRTLDQAPHECAGPAGASQQRP